MFCPCWFGVQELMIMDQGWCASVIGFRIREGRSDGVALDGRKVVFTPDFPGPTLFDGNATARVFVDEGADEAQQRELEAIFQGRKGGPMENLAPLVATWLPTKKASIGIEEEGETITVSVAGAGEMRSQLLRDPQGNAFTLRGGWVRERTGPGGGQPRADERRLGRPGNAQALRNEVRRAGGLHLERLSSNH